MSGTKISKKVRFLPYFPYGYCSKQATTIEGKENPYATMFLMGEDPDAVIQQCDRYRKKALDRARYLCEKGYAKDIVRTCSTPKMKRSFRRLTKLGLAVMMEAPDEAAAGDQDETSQDEAFNGKIKEDHFRTNIPAYADLRDQLCEYTNSPDPEKQRIFDQLLLEAVITKKTTPLSYAIGLIQDTGLDISKYSQNQIYNIWRLSHVNAMFQANGHLTYLDRRPYDTGFAIDGIVDEDSYQAYVEKHGNTMPSITYYALSNWYKRNPNFYRITQNTPDDSDAGREQWMNTPAFYSTRELPNYDTQNTDKTDFSKRGTPHTLRFTHIGLATGKKVNYVCYHGRPGAFRWVPKREQIAKAEIEQSVRLMKTRCPEVKCQDTVDFALYFCSSMPQFAALFARTAEKHIPGKKLKYTTDAPYASTHAIPVNDSGTFLLWCLMESSPIQIEQMFHNSLVEANMGFAYSMDRYYPLTYKGKRVFSGYTMDISKINHVLEDYLDGYDFYICCLPDQAPWYKKIFPERTFL